MSSMGLSDPEKPLKKTSVHHHHRRHGSGELGVFQASRYFSGAGDLPGSYTKPSVIPHRRTNRDDARDWRSERRISLDVPMKTLIPLPDHHHHHHHHHLHHHHQIQQSIHQTVRSQILKENSKQHKQPRSPGGRLASFLNSLFHQAALKKKNKNKKKSSSNPNSEEESPSAPAAGSRKRRSAADSNLNPSGQIKSVINLKSPTISQIDQEQKQPNPPPCYNKRNRGFPWLDEKPKLSHANNGSLPEKKIQRNFGDGFFEKDRIWIDDYRTEEKEIGKFGVDGDYEDNDDGGESDSSSDLFELENYDLGLYASTGLPVYETTRMDNIKRAAPISLANGPV